MRPKTPTTKAKNRWADVSKSLTPNKVAKAAFNSADSDVVQSKPPFRSPEAEEKRKAALRAYWAKRRKNQESTKRYMEKYNLRGIGFRIPANIADRFHEICDANDLCKAEVIARLLTGWIQRNEYPSQD